MDEKGRDLRHELLLNPTEEEMKVYFSQFVKEAKAKSKVKKKGMAVTNLHIPHTRPLKNAHPVISIKKEDDPEVSVSNKGKGINYPIYFPEGLEKGTSIKITQTMTEITLHPPTKDRKYSSESEHSEQHDTKIEYEENKFQSSNGKKSSNEIAGTRIYQNRIVEIPLSPFDENIIQLTIPEKDILKYLKDNDTKILEENKHKHEKRLSIFKAISRITGIHEKTLKRIARNGPKRKSGSLKFFFFFNC